MSVSYDVIINGASVAGCTAATLYARRGARVALLEKRSDPRAYKVLCTHYIQPCGYQTIAELGLVEALEAAGAVRNSANYWTRWGWIRPEPPDQPRTLPHGYNVRRETLDPILRDLAARTPGVDLLLGHTVDGLVREGDRVAGVTGTAAGFPFELRARLVVGADGANSTIAQLAGAPEKAVDNERFSYFAYWKNVPRPEGDVTLAWFREPDVAYAMPNDGDTMLIACIPTKEKLSEFKQNLEGAYRRFIATLPGAPDLTRAELASKIMGVVNHRLIVRESTGLGYALIGDAALTSDPLWGIGCGWAFQSGHWLVDATAAAVQGVGDLDRALAGYRRKRTRLKGYQFLIADYASGRPFNPIERLMFSAAARDPRTAELFHRFGSRMIGVRQFLSPAAMGRAAMVNTRHHLQSNSRPALAAA